MYAGLRANGGLLFGKLLYGRVILGDRKHDGGIWSRARLRELFLYETRVDLDVLIQGFQVFFGSGGHLPVP